MQVQHRRPAVARRLAPPREQRGPIGRDDTVVGDIDFVGDRLRFVVEVPQHGVERDAAAGDVTGRPGWRRTAAFERRGENRGHLGVQREGHLGPRPLLRAGRRKHFGLVIGHERLRLGDEGRLRGGVERRRSLGSCGDGLADQGEELLLP